MVRVALVILVLETGSSSLWREYLVSFFFLIEKHMVNSGLNI